MPEVPKITATLVRQLDHRTVAASATRVVTEVSEARDTTRSAAVEVVELCAHSLFLPVHLPARVSAGRGGRDGTV